MKLLYEAPSHHIGPGQNQPSAFYLIPLLFLLYVRPLSAWATGFSIWCIWWGSWSRSTPKLTSNNNNEGGGGSSINCPRSINHQPWHLVTDGPTYSNGTLSSSLPAIHVAGMTIMDIILLPGGLDGSTPLPTMTPPPLLIGGRCTIMRYS